MLIDSESQTSSISRTKPEEDAEEWEDVPNTDLARHDSDISVGRRASSVRQSTPSRTRRRKVGRTASVSLAQAHPTPRRVTTQPRLPTAAPRKAFELNGDQVQDVLTHGAASFVRYSGSIFTHAFQLLKRPLGYLVFLYLLGLLLGFLFARFRAAFAPICWIPGISSSALCRIPGIPENVLRSPQRVDYPRLVEIQSSSFEQLLDGAIGGPALGLEIKKAEMATKDLITLVKYSQLKSRDSLAESLYNFVQDAKKTGKGLQKLTAKINGAVDNIMAINDYALHTIEGAQAQPNSLMRVIWPFGVEPPTQAAALEAFHKSMEVHASEMKRLILEVEVSSTNLDALEEHLATLHDICARENLSMSSARDALLSDLWTILGGNRDRVRSFNANLELLRDLGEYRRRAAAHVAAAMHTLQAMGEDMEDLRERVSAPELVGDVVPVEVHMKSIRAGMDRLKEQRVKAKEREEMLMSRILGIEE
ncbi:hypothetical protein BD309DRAFT_1003167 [Dichomitus squalens]|uniref:Uncharacterized protein n=1 Tax=Dichomitus squalens TaxID=114155 RepID=A0A4V2K3F0_9APHY|nr:uncharacterized protein DICSQDRAFT_80591 [Dichomitus squalens LYAD-421 SS1]EJF64846.1 hypothetical protein DICSQDRAFT_80591 [Dichomitus squalens LYAD-421 SS1]TBU40323.1 hypothetical protein BD309DRAFT_1003167 [Dichomitus squalens]TBU62806.1 hypothetical protein BD310DRAFT_871007 [Dichomitus squalens]